MLSHPCPRSEYSEDFIKGMLDRMAVSFHKYGRASDAFPFRVDALDSLTQRLREYRRTGNTEFLIDAANFAMLEFMFPARSDAHYTPTDADQSPGRKDTSGNTTFKTNADLGAKGRESC